MPYMELFRGEGRKTWQLRMTDHKGIRRQLSTRSQDRGTALAVSQKIERMIDLRIRGDGLPQDLVEWVNSRHQDIRAKLVDWEIVDGRVTTATSLLYNLPAPDPVPPDWKPPPPALVDLWETEMIEAEVSEDHAKQTAARVRTLLQFQVAGQLPIRYPAEISGAGVLARIRELRKVGPVPMFKARKRKPLGPRTCQYYLDRAREFCDWLISRGILTANPLKDQVAYTEAVMRAAAERQRRALTAEEQVKLITQTPQLAERWGMTGVERALIYHTVLRTGLRASELASLRALNLNFFTKQITVLAEDSKAKREDTLPIAAELVELLREQVKGKLPATLVFTRLGPKKYCSMLREDLEELGIPFKDALGHYADFHALRHTYGTELAKVVMPARHMKLMRHQDIRTTMDYYVHVEQADMADGLAKLPPLTAAADLGKATG